MRQYPIDGEPTQAEFEAWAKVEFYLDQMEVATWLDNERATVTDCEFDRLVDVLHSADFSDARWDVIQYEYERITRERSGK